MRKGLIHLYTGDGKGKTTAAVGLCVRACGRGMRVLFAQFLKGEDSGERKILRLIPGCVVAPNLDTIKFSFQLSPAERAEAIADNDARFAHIAGQAVEEGFDLLILDEAVGALSAGLLSPAPVYTFLRAKPTALEVVLTGRDPAAELESLADYHTDMQKKKHPFDTGRQARKGIEI